ncbi:MAG: ribosome-binding factor A [Halothiobacillus sp. 24-54-40]|jgi:ribosome-binding factor A|nr:30S ribosome-binding factor RbfA [Halothiobacillaceae bacterium]OYV45470.1 MAG: ribosome-binding factor A [Halothiobacillus sp. 20-53-49]OYY43894.1 MAG: ribosome-binding factor A [Halothiobacillus sp. 35-54-62]OYY56642.1 MAG: ribosome-binding factor A [Halothiobacillus sp. 28-55-5]OYZ88248.1 MAG: ribosome-binding factor A [Halothiobacillus sp. 24-54-40]OZA81340.1 MAG: ribosome-binding factor A [Halothiobacillus sp. 39-53-45]HQS01914.1 30S ribosome-binding factor RbfA [Halothiobacillus sp.]
MAQGFSRHQRVAEQIRREIADLLREEIRQANISLLTVTDCEVTRDLSYAKIFYSVLNIDERERAQAWLDGAAGFLRTELAHRMRLRSVPRLSFVFDPSIERGMQMDALISAVRRQDDAHDGGVDAPDEPTQTKAGETS